jgi:A/G-specific adenine glycosylase
VPTSISVSSETETALTILSHLLECPLLSNASSKVPQPVDAPRLVKIERGGDVLHVFSHIRKTYRVQWVVLEGGGANPPELATRSASKVKKVKGQGSSSKIESMWVRLGEVGNAK